MRRLCCFPLCSTALAIAFTLAAASPARSQGPPDDVSIAVVLEMSRSPGVATSLNFKILVEVASGAGAEQRFTMRISLPPGLRWGADDPDPSEGCTGTQPAVCTQVMQRNQVGTVGGGWSWDVVAERGGFYEITATVEPERPDPNSSNNNSTSRIEVRPPTSGGGGGGGASAVLASSVKLVPAKPKAGSVAAASVRVTAGGTGVRPSKLRCVGTVAGARVPVSPRAGTGSATCRYRPPKTAKGKTLRGTISFTARGRSFTRRFATRLG